MAHQKFVRWLLRYFDDKQNCVHVSSVSGFASFYIYGAVYVTVSATIFLLCLFLSLTLSLPKCLSQYLFLCLCLCMYVFVTVSVFMSACVWSICVRVPPSILLFMSGIWCLREFCLFVGYSTSICSSGSYSETISRFKFTSLFTKKISKLVV